MLVIRKKDNPLSILSYGYVESGGLGEYDRDLFEEVELEELPENWEKYKEKPLAMGLELIKFINETTITALSDEQAFALIEKVQPFILFLEQGRCNPCSEATFRTALSLLDKKLANGNKALIVGLVEEWAKDKRFFQPRIESPQSGK